MMNLVKLLRDAIIPRHKPAVYISGGLDSTILLHHLREKTEEEIFTYTFGFPDDHEFNEAEQVAEHYDTSHTEVLIEKVMKDYPFIVQLLTRPRFNLWIFHIIMEAYKDNRQICYCGEGMDEHFGGYWYKYPIGYAEAWADHWTYIRPTWVEIHNFFNLRLEMPFADLPVNLTLPYWDPLQSKSSLKHAYRGILPEFVLKRRKRRAGPDWKKLWDRELSLYYPKMKPASSYEIREIFNVWVTELWLKYLHLFHVETAQTPLQPLSIPS